MVMIAARAVIQSAALFVLVPAAAWFSAKAEGPQPALHNPAWAAMPGPVDQVFRRACKDCHSNETVWPWYSKIRPLSFAIASDVHRGRAIFNMSEWSSYSVGRKRGFLVAIQVDVARGNMPPRSYRLLHPESSLSAQEQALLRSWAKEESARLRSMGAKTAPAFRTRGLATSAPVAAR